MTQKTDSFYMKHAVRLAKRAFGMTSPNPLVGAVIVKNGRIIGEGWHKRCGGPHAEVEAIRSLRKPAQAEGATIYVTLEPCSTFGRTPPCCEAIIEHKFKRVVIGGIDPNPKHAGAAVSRLQECGIEVVTGVEQKACEALNVAFFHWITTKRPFVLLKMAETLDGRIATVSGSSQWITGDDAARKRVRELRLWCDAIAAGSETFRLDHPALTARDAAGNVLKTPRRFLATHQNIAPEGFETFAADTAEEWNAFLDRLGAENITSLLIEGGGELAASALAADAVDYVEFHIAPKLLGGRDSRPVLGGESPEFMSLARKLYKVTTEQYGEDIAVCGYTRE